MKRGRRRARSLPAWRGALTYSAVLLAGTIIFFVVHHLANQTSYKVAKYRVRRAFEKGDLIAEYTFDSAIPMRSTASLIGLAQFTECQVISAALADAAPSDSEETALSRALNPSYLQSAKYPRHYCKGLKAISVDNDAYRRNRLKTRYWWGSTAIYGILLQHFGVFEIRQFIQTFTYFAYLAVAVILARLSGGVLLVVSPFIVFGVGLSAIPYFASISQGVGYGWAIAAVAIITLLEGRGASLGCVRLAAFCAGMVSAYVWLGDGHTMLAISMFAAVIYFVRRMTEGPIASFRHALVCTGFYILGFVGAYASGQVVKAAYFGWGRVGSSISSQAAVDIGHVGTRHGQGLTVLPYFYEVTLLGRGLGQAFSVLSGLASVAGVSMVLYVAGRRQCRAMVLDVAVPLLLMLVCYFYFLMGNDNVFVFARYAFLPHALAWSCLLIGIMDWRCERNPARERS